MPFSCDYTLVFPKKTPMYSHVWGFLVFPLSVSIPSCKSSSHINNEEDIQEVVDGPEESGLMKESCLYREGYTGQQDKTYSEQLPEVVKLGARNNYTTVGISKVTSYVLKYFL